MALQVRDTLLNSVDKLTPKDREFAASLLRSAYPTPKQIHWMTVLVERIQANSKPVETAQVNNVSSMVALLSKGATKLKRPRVKFLAGDLHLCLSIMGERSRCAGSIGVTSAEGNDWFGYIHRDGTFEPSRRNTPEASTAIVAALVAFGNNPEKASREYGQIMGCCCYCSKDLVDPVSRYVGYGPICAERYSLPHRIDGLTTEQVHAQAEAEALAVAA